MDILLISIVTVSISTSLWITVAFDPKRDVFSSDEEPILTNF